MILVDTSVWIDHFRLPHRALADLLERGSVLGHAWVAGELALGQLSRRREILGFLRSLPRAEVATVDEVATFIEANQLPGTGIGYVDAQLLASTRLTPDARLWTGDKRLRRAASRLGLLGGPAAA